LYNFRRLYIPGAEAIGCVFIIAEKSEEIGSIAVSSGVTGQRLRGLLESGSSAYNNKKG
jgi:hypothetical protein